jgi:ATP-dependent Clp protease adaptor protein ClpS
MADGGVRSTVITQTKAEDAEALAVSSTDSERRLHADGIRRLRTRTQFFNKSREDATRIMLHVHQNGVGVCGVFTYEVAETKVAQVIDSARRHQHPLQCTMEKD